jgi:hypothetical protein
VIGEPIASTAPGPVDPDGLWLDDLAEGMTFRSAPFVVWRRPA